MIVNSILAIVIILIVMLVWVLVQHLARQFAVRHPEFGPYPEGPGSCGSCSSGSCSRKKHEGERR